LIDILNTSFFIIIIIIISSHRAINVYSSKQQKRQTGQTHTYRYIRSTSCIRYKRHKTKVFRLSDLHNS